MLQLSLREWQWVMHPRDLLPSCDMQHIDVAIPSGSGKKRTVQASCSTILCVLFPEQDPEACSRSLLALLLARVTSPTVAPITRSAAAAYLASFLARASFVPDAVLVDALQVCG